MFKRLKKGGEGSIKDKGKRKARDEGISNPYGIIFRNDTQKTRFDTLSRRKIVGTRYIDNVAMETLGLKDDIQWMIDRLGWTTFLSCHYPTYPRVILEFLSSLEADILSPQGKISFRLFNDDYSWTMDEFNGVFDFPLGGERHVPSDFITHHFWRRISDQREHYDPSRSKASTLPNPNFKYFHRVMANTIFGRGESDGVVRSSELLMMWAALEDICVDSGSHFVRHLMKIAKGASGSIVIGGLLTRIAVTLGCDLDGLETVKRSPRIDLETCLAMKWLIKEDGQYKLVMRDRFPLPLPDISHTSIHNQHNWRMTDTIPTPPSMDLPMDLPPPPPPSTRHEPSRHSFSFGGSSAGPSSAFDFSEFRSSFERMHTDFVEQQNFLREQARTSDERYQRVEQFMERSEHFYNQAADYFQAEEQHRQRQLQEWEKEEEHRLRMQHTSQQLNQIYGFHEHLGSLPYMPRFPPPPPY